MARLIAPNGATVNVSDERAERLLVEGYQRAEKGERKTSPKKTTAKSSSDK